jgi:hypothetical protein
MNNLREHPSERRRVCGSWERCLLDDAPRLPEGYAMSDDKQATGGQDRKRINVNEDYELRDWSKKFNVTPDELRAAVKAVGDQADRVEEHLKRKRT